MRYRIRLLAKASERFADDGSPRDPGRTGLSQLGQHLPRTAITQGTKGDRLAVLRAGEPLP